MHYNIITLSEFAFVISNLVFIKNDLNLQYFFNEDWLFLCLAILSIICCFFQWEEDICRQKDITSHMCLPSPYTPSDNVSVTSMDVCRFYHITLANDRVRLWYVTWRYTIKEVIARQTEMNLIRLAQQKILDWTICLGNTMARYRYTAGMACYGHHLDTVITGVILLVFVLILGNNGDMVYGVISHPLFRNEQGQFQNQTSFYEYNISAE
jgi:hypothetical protein